MHVQVIPFTLVIMVRHKFKSQFFSLSDAGVERVGSVSCPDSLIGHIWAAARFFIPIRLGGNAIMDHS